MTSGPDRKIPIWRTAVAAYRLGIGAVFSNGALFRYFIYASLFSLGILALQFYLTALQLAAVTQPQSPGRATLSMAGSMLLSVGYAAAICPFAVAMHRHILLGETPRSYYLAAGRKQLRFLLATIGALMFVISMIMIAVTAAAASRAYEIRVGGMIAVAEVFS